MVRRSSVKMSSFYKVRTKAISILTEERSVPASTTVETRKSWSPEKDVVIIGADVWFFGGLTGNLDWAVLINKHPAAKWFTDYRDFDDGLLAQRDIRATPGSTIESPWDLCIQLRIPQIGNYPSGIMVEEGEWLFVHEHIDNWADTEAYCTLTVVLYYVELE